MPAYASSAKIATAEAKLGGPIALDSSLLLKQLVVALGNVTSGGGGGGSGTVTSVSVTTQNGVSATVTNPTTTPALAFTLGAITPTTVQLSGAVSGTTLLQSPPIAGSAVVTFPSVTGTLAIIGNPLSQFAATTSAQLAGVISDETGSGSLVFATSPTLVTPLLGTPTSGTLTNCTGLPVSSGISGFGTSVATALAVNVGIAGSIVVNGGAMGTPTSGTLTSCTGLPISTGVSGLGTGVATTLATNLSITGGGTISLGGFTLTVPATGTASLLGTAQTYSAAKTFSANGAASTPPVALTGTWFTGGTATTTKPQLLVEPTGTTSAAWSTNGTGIGVNAASGFTGNLLDLQLAGTTKFSVTSAGATSIASLSLNFGNITLGGSANFYNDVNASNFINLYGYGGLYFTTGISTRLVSDANTFQFGNDAAGVSNQLVRSASRITSDGVGSNLTISAGNGRGAAGGTLILSTYTTAGAGTIGTLTSRMTIDTAGAVAFPNVTAVTTETVVSDRTWPVTINGVSYKICLKA